MKTNIIQLMVLGTCYLFLNPLIAQERLNVEGAAAGSPLLNIQVTDITAMNDIIQIDAPTSPTSTSGQFIECQKGGSIVMQINWDGTTFFTNEMNLNGDILFDDSGTQSSSEIIMEDNDNNQTIIIHSKDGASDIGGEILLKGGVGAPTTIEIDGNWAGTGKGRIRTDELEIEGGADIAETFDVVTAAGHEYAELGMLVSIDPERAGQLIVCGAAYDAKIAGVISGANGVRTGLYMGQKGSVADGSHPVAIAGRVYVKADARYGAIQPGDLLTSSDTPGHAMKVRNHRKARGAVIGKAMSALDDGTGYVLVLISLQ